MASSALPSLTTLVAILFATTASAGEPRDPVGFGKRQPIPGTLTLNASETGRDARLTPVRDNYRPKLVFDGREVVCMVRFTPGLQVIEPGGSGEVNLACEEPVAVRRAGTRARIREGSKDVGYVDVRLPPADEARP